LWSETGDYRPKQNYQKGHSAKITDWEGFRQFVEANSGLTQKEMGVILGVSSYNRWSSPEKINFTRKKNILYEEQNEEERQQFIKMMKEERMKIESILTSLGWIIEMFMIWWGLKGQRIYGQRPGKKERENKHNEWLSFREIGCTIYWIVVVICKY
jgi:hypothetical protein